MSLRSDLQKIANDIPPGAHVLDLGCGDGELLAYLAARGVSGYGVEIDVDNVIACVERGVDVIQGDLEAGLAGFADQSFDSVVMAQALQAVDAPDVLLRDMVRVGKQAIITFPNFAYWKTRSFLALKGKMPVSEALPYMWYNTPNIHLCTFRDFEALCAENRIKIINRLAVNGDQQGSMLSKHMPNLFGEVAIYRVSAL